MGPEGRTPASHSIQGIQTGIRRNLVEPCSERRPALVRIEPPPGAQKRFLDQVFGFVQGAEDAITVNLQLAAVRLG
jgi:hypothetical protein